MIVGVAVAAIATSCGGEAKSFSEHANEICRKYDRLARAAGRPDQPVESIDERLTKIARDRLRELRSLDPPPAAAETARRWLAAEADELRVSAAIDRLPVGARDFRRRFRALGRRSEALERRASTLANRVGARACGRHA